MNHKITSFLIAETSRTRKGKEAPSAPPTKSAPHYFEKSVPAQHILGSEKVKIGEREVELSIKTYYPDAILVEGTVEVESVFAEGIFDLKEKLLEECFRVAKKKGGREEPSEEYTIYQISGYQGHPELFLKSHGQKIAALLKSEKVELDDEEVEHTLSSYQFKYAKDDLIIVDWDGAFVFDPDGEYGEAVEMFELANYQLLRYRILDEDLDERMKRASKLSLAESEKWFLTKEITQAFRELIKIRSQSITQYESMERDIKLIGDWYSARLFSLLAKKFRLEEWRKSVQNKLDSLEDIYGIVSENLGFSRMQVLELVQIGAFFILQIGWFVLIILEFFYFTR
jgi:hypothetical protein